MERKNKLVTNILDNANVLTFKYNGLHCGVEGLALNKESKFALWFGDQIQYFDSLEELMNFKMFDGLTVLELDESIKFEYC